MKTPFHIDPYSIEKNNMHILQINPRIAVNLGKGDHCGWIFAAESERQEDWVKIRKLSPQELHSAYDQVADMAVLDAGGKSAASENVAEDPQKALLAKLFKSRPEAPPSLVVRTPGK